MRKLDWLKRDAARAAEVLGELAADLSDLAMVWTDEHRQAAAEALEAVRELAAVADGAARAARRKGGAS